MAFDFDGTGIEPSDGKGNTKIIKKGWYQFKVIEYESRKGDRYPMEGRTKEKNYPKVEILCEIVDGSPDFLGDRVFHTVTFMPKGSDGAGMAIHWLKTIRQPWEGAFKVNSDAWINEKFMGYVTQDSYNGKTKNKISQVAPIESKQEAEIPF